jgi:nucleoid-associated protein EbfC
VSMGRGGFNPNQMLKQLQKMQQQMEQAQEQLAEEVVEGSAGGDLVTAAVNEGLRKAKDLASERLGGLTRGIGLPPGMGL